MADNSSDSTEEALRRLNELLANLDCNLQQIKLALAHIAKQIDEGPEDAPGQ